VTLSDDGGIRSGANIIDEACQEMILCTVRDNLILW
jgi:hypothetical protein